MKPWVNDRVTNLQRRYLMANIKMSYHAALLYFSSFQRLTFDFYQHLDKSH